MLAQMVLGCFDAPNTPAKEITRGGAYHNISRWIGPTGIVHEGTVDKGDHTPAPCRKCKAIARPAHTCDGPRLGLQVFCGAHCPKCIAFRAGTA